MMTTRFTSLGFIAILQLIAGSHGFQPGTSMKRTWRSTYVQLQAAREANLSYLSTLQGPLQDTLAPGHWLGQSQFKSRHVGIQRQECPTRQHSHNRCLGKSLGRPTRKVIDSRIHHCPSRCSKDTRPCLDQEGMARRFGRELSTHCQGLYRQGQMLRNWLFTYLYSRRSRSQYRSGTFPVCVARTQWKEALARLSFGKVGRLGPFQSQGLVIFN